MVKQFPDIFNVDFTSAMEEELDKVEDGELGWQKVLKNFYSPVREAPEQGRRAGADRRSARSLGGRRSVRCPDCGGKLEARGGFFGPFLACENHPKTCKYTRPIKGEQAKPVMTEHMCHVCGEPMVMRQGRSGEFLGCSTFPKCRGTRSMPTGVFCPKDGGELVERRSQEARHGVLRVLERGVRLRRLEQARRREVSGVRLRRRRDEVHQGARRLPQMPEVRQRVGRAED